MNILSRPSTLVSMINCRFPDRIVVQQRPDQAIDGMTSEIFGNGQYLSASIGGGDDEIAASNGERQRLFAHRVQSEIQERGALTR